MAHKSPLRAYHDADEMRAIDRSYVELDAFYEAEGSEPLSCVISNISPMGAQVGFDGETEVPDQIKLRVPDLDMVFWADVKWRDGESIGVRFTQSEQL